MTRRPATVRLGLVIGQLDYGGAETQLAELALRLPDHYEPVVYCLSDRDEPHGSRLRRAGVAVKRIPAVRHYDIARTRRLARLLREDRIELAHAFLYIASAYTYVATRGAGAPRFVASARNCKREKTILRSWVMRRALHGADAVICNSKEMARFAARHYRARTERTHVVYNGVDLDRFPFRGVVPLTHRIGAIGRLEKQKDWPTFLRAAAQLLKSRPGVEFEIVGEGSERARLEGLARQLGIAGSVRFAGTRSDVEGFLTTLDQFWLTSTWEGTPNVVLEAMAVGVPVLATRVGGVPELIEDGRTGMLVEPGAPSSLVARSVHLFEDPAECERLVRNARGDVEKRFSTGQMVTETCRVYESVLGERA